MQILDGESGAVLDTRSLSGFSNGIYLVWSLTGHVTVKFTNTGPQNAVLSGMFFGDGAFGSAPIDHWSVRLGQRGPPSTRIAIPVAGFA